MPWQIDVFTPDGLTLRRSLTPADPVHSFGWSVRGDGDCLEGIITGHGLDIRAREIVIIRAKARPTDSGQPTVRYVGWVVEVPAARAPGLTSCRLMGGRKRLTEILTRSFSLSGASELVAWNAASEVNLLNNPRLVRRSPQFPAQGFTAGERFPVLETVAETLEASANMVPSFKVEPATTYVYNGRTYQPGEQVPPTMWGVRAEAADGGRGYVFFERPNPTPAVLNELTDRLSIEWRPREAETVVDDVTVVVLETNNADAVSANVFGLFPSSQPKLSRPVVHREQLPGSPYGSQLRIGAEGEGLMTADFVAAPVTVGWENGANAFDGDAGTYASNSGVINNLARRAEWPAVIWRVRYSSHVDFTTDVYRLEGLTATRHIWRLRSTSGNQVEQYLQAPSIKGAAAEASITFHSPVDADAGTIRIYEATPLKPDPEALRRLALSHMRVPSAAPAAAATIPNRILDPSWRWTLNLADGGAVTGVAEQIDYLVDVEAGFTTRIHLEQALTAEETATRALLDSKIRQAVRLGARPTA